MATSVTHEVWIELCSGGRAFVGQEIATRAEASAIANTWIRIARDEPDGMHETMTGSGIVVRGSAIVAVRVQKEVPRRPLAPPRDGSWL
ncbi:hypothetical protein GIS00_21170 [Nakamurella sp. YIM 132087]|uniref:Uncharacterized protein n=1 Tax=Nakamurella alba TaxID=2665158 RepID=A0A7K1FQN0_9ACTN|nr:hypothetical protein [Nakamurella alba]MTD16451.1 hypothetical protein [Nakamurella alba]